MKKETIVNFITEFIEVISKEITEMKLSINQQCRIAARYFTNSLANNWFLINQSSSLSFYFSKYFFLKFSAVVPIAFECTTCLPLRDELDIIDLISLVRGFEVLIVLGLDVLDKSIEEVVAF